MNCTNDLFYKGEDLYRINQTFWINGEWKNSVQLHQILQMALLRFQIQSFSFS